MQPRKFASLRSSPRASAPAASPEEPIEMVFRRHMIASADGQRLLAWMRDATDDVQPVTASEAALRDAEGQRRFVQRFLRLAEASS